MVADIQASSLMGRVHAQEANDLEEQPEGDHHARHPSCMAEDHLLSMLTCLSGGTPASLSETCREVLPSQFRPSKKC